MGMGERGTSAGVAVEKMGIGDGEGRTDKDGMVVATGEAVACKPVFTASVTLIVGRAVMLGTARAVVLTGVDGTLTRNGMNRYRETFVRPWDNVTPQIEPVRATTQPKNIATTKTNSTSGAER